MNDKMYMMLMIPAIAIVGIFCVMTSVAIGEVASHYEMEEPPVSKIENIDLMKELKAQIFIKNENFEGSIPLTITYPSFKEMNYEQEDFYVLIGDEWVLQPKKPYVAYVGSFEVISAYTELEKIEFYSDGEYIGEINGGWIVLDNEEDYLNQTVNVKMDYDVFDHDGIEGMNYEI